MNEDRLPLWVWFLTGVAIAVEAAVAVVMLFAGNSWVR
jgi:hypothetical protein